MTPGDQGSVAELLQEPGGIEPRAIAPPAKQTPAVASPAIPYQQPLAIACRIPRASAGQVLPAPRMRRRVTEPGTSCQHDPPQVVNGGSHRDEVQAGPGEETADQAGRHSIHLRL